MQHFRTYPSLLSVTECGCSSQFLRGFLSDFVPHARLCTGMHLNTIGFAMCGGLTDKATAALAAVSPRLAEQYLQRKPPFQIL